MLRPIQQALVTLELAALPNQSDGLPLETGRSALATVLGISNLITSSPLGPEGVTQAVKATGEGLKLRNTVSKFTAAGVGMAALLLVL